MNENVFFEIRILVKFLATKLATKRTDSGMNQAMCSQSAGSPELFSALRALHKFVFKSKINNEEYIEFQEMGNFWNKNLPINLPPNVFRSGLLPASRRSCPWKLKPFESDVLTGRWTKVSASVDDKIRSDSLSLNPWPLGPVWWQDLAVLTGLERRKRGANASNGAGSFDWRSNEIHKLNSRN